MNDFWATEAALNTVMLAYNLMSLLRQVVEKVLDTDADVAGRNEKNGQLNLG